MDYNSKEGKELLKDPLIPLVGKKKDFIKHLFLKLMYKKAKTIIYYQKEEIIRLLKREKNQTGEIKKLQIRNKEINTELKFLKQKYNARD